MHYLLNTNTKKPWAKILSSFCLLSLLAACSSMPAPKQSETSSARLGTQWGEGLESNVHHVQASRITPLQAEQVASIAYREARALNQSLPNAARQLNLPLLQGAIEWSVLDENDRPIPLLRTAQGQILLGGTNGARYTLKFQNLSNRDFEIVTTVDGLDVLNGQAGSLNNTGYLLNAHRTLSIQGFRKSQEEVAAFRFAAPDQAYAANTQAGDTRNIGVIGVAIFRVALKDRSKSPQPNPFPADSTYAAPPSY
ncbi:hypothetical protein [Janthinobacterium sp. B9-8]|uniref:hypothetical protein n=1 Tax=Janthinobacterium sp. B9-8 TaxID=1236179 RepID=UPI00061D1100|nr:hypothetical protein [Janthinobacterium sp. B9-8]AMC35209.1 hypothetical protein VN23_11585 [Janthinobacterium sp. B9-8]